MIHSGRHEHALKSMTITEDRVFLLTQTEKGRSGCRLGSIDTKLVSAAVKKTAIQKRKFGNLNDLVINRSSLEKNSVQINQ